MNSLSQITLHPLSSKKSGSSEFCELQQSDQEITDNRDRTHLLKVI